MNVTWHNANLALAWLDDSRAVWSDQTGLGLRLHDGFDLDHIEGGNTLSDAHDEVHFGLDSFENSIGGKGGWDVDDGSVGVSGSLGSSDVAENWEIEMSGACLALVDTTNHLGAVSQSLLSVESSLEKQISAVRSIPQSV